MCQSFSHRLYHLASSTITPSQSSRSRAARERASSHTSTAQPARLSSDVIRSTISAVCTSFVTYAASRRNRELSSIVFGRRWLRSLATNASYVPTAMARAGWHTHCGLLLAIRLITHSLAKTAGPKMTNKPEFDILLWGGSSFTGRLVAEHLHKTYGVDGPIRWAIGGRNQRKLEDTRAGLGAGAEALPIIVGDARDRQFLCAMVERTNVVLSTIGPYALYGKELIEACAASGTDYCDLAGEIPFIQEMMDRHAVQSRASGARILNCCGVDSLPSDLGVWSLNEISKKQFGCGLAHVTTEVKSFNGQFSGGTISSLGGMHNDAARDERVADILDNPYAICPPDRRTGVTQPDIAAVRRSESGTWLGPFFMAIVNTRVVHATNAHLDYPYGTDFIYDEGWDVGSRLAASFLALVSRIFYRAYGFGPMRAFLNATVLPKPGEGPSRKAREEGDFEFHFLARTRTGDRLTLVISGDRDPGYGSTSRMIGEVAVCLARDLPKSALSGGFWTPGAAIADRIIPRLVENAGMTFALLTETGERCPLGSALSDSGTLNTSEDQNIVAAIT